MKDLVAAGLVRTVRGAVWGLYVSGAELIVWRGAATLIFQAVQSLNAALHWSLGESTEQQRRMPHQMLCIMLLICELTS